MNLLNFTCAWCFIANSTLLNIEWPDGNSQYYGTIINNTKFKLNGIYPDARYFSYEVYSIDTWEPFWDIHDNMIDTNNNPYIYDIPYNHSLHYSLDIDINVNNSSDNYILIYRIYKGINNTGGVQLPELEVYNNNQYNVIQQCNNKNRPTIDIQNNDPYYNLYHSNENNNFYLPQDTENLFINYDARYLVAFYNNSKKDFKFAKIQAKIPTFPKSFDKISYNDYDVRYFSFSIIDLSSPRQTTQTIHDEILYNSSINDYVTLYLFCHNINNISLQLFPPTKDNNYNCSHNIEYFGVLYRQLLPQYKQQIPNMNFMSNKTISKKMGDYYPTIFWQTK
tara:strand:- start:29604 stop:30611 length:1008 start_codon:yes stop_codon:yes gene_type:complete